LKFDKTHKDEISELYKLDKTKLIKKYNKKSTLSSITLHTKESLIPTSEIKTELNETNYEKQKEFLQEIKDDLIEVITVEGNFCTPETLIGLIQLTKQHTHKLESERKQYKSIIEAATESQSEILERFQEINNLNEKHEFEKTQKASEIQKLDQKLKELKQEFIKIEKTKEEHKPTIPETKPLNMATNLKSVIEPPRWEDNNGNTKAENLDNFLRDITIFNDLKLFQEPQETIFMALSKSSKLDIYNELSENERKDLTEFKKFLRANYGSSDESRRQELDRLKQNKNESAHSFFRRVINVYYKSRGNDTIPNTDTINDTDKQNDIKYHFLKGLRNEQVATLCRTNNSTINFTDLGKKAAEYEQVLETTQPKTTNNYVNKITENSENEKLQADLENARHLNTEMVNALKGLSLQQRPYSNQTGQGYQNYRRDKRNDQCYRCQGYGHWANECRASKKVMRQQSRSRGRNRSSSGTRYRRQYSQDRRQYSQDRRQRSYSNQRRNNTPHRRWNSRERPNSKGRNSRSNSRERR